MSTDSESYESVLAVWDYYDGPRSGIAMYRDAPHVFRSLGLDEESDSTDDVFLLQPIEPDTLALALEDWHIWVRWRAANLAGEAPPGSHPALPVDRSRHEVLRSLLADRLVTPGAVIYARATFRGQLPDRGTLEVRWVTLTPWRVIGPPA